MKKILVSLLCLFLLTFDVKAEVVNPEAVSNFLDRIFCQQPTANSQQPILTILDENLVQQPDAFIITSKDGKPCIKGNSISAITTGINWYLNHYANINISWNQLTINDIENYNWNSACFHFREEKRRLLLFQQSEAMKMEILVF